MKKYILISIISVLVLFGAVSSSAQTIDSRADSIVNTMSVHVESIKNTYVDHGTSVVNTAVGHMRSVSNTAEGHFSSIINTFLGKISVGSEFLLQNNKYQAINSLNSVGAETTSSLNNLKAETTSSLNNLKAETTSSLNGEKAKALEALAGLGLTSSSLVLYKNMVNTLYQNYIDKVGRYDNLNRQVIDWELKVLSLASISSGKSLSGVIIEDNPISVPRSSDIRVAWLTNGAIPNVDIWVCTKAGPCFPAQKNMINTSSPVRVRIGNNIPNNSQAFVRIKQPGSSIYADSPSFVVYTTATAPTSQAKVRELANTLEAIKQLLSQMQ